MRRIILTGATVGAAGLTAMSAAWACTATGVSIFLNTASGAAGSAVEVRGVEFNQKVVERTDSEGKVTSRTFWREEVEIRWNGPAGRLVTTVTNEDFTTTVTVPAGAVPGDYFVVALQRDTAGIQGPTSVAPFRVTGTTSGSVSPPPTETQTPPEVIVQPEVVVPSAGPSNQTPSNQTPSNQSVPSAAAVPSVLAQVAVASPVAGPRGTSAVGSSQVLSAATGPAVAVNDASSVVVPSNSVVPIAGNDSLAVLPEDAPLPSLTDLWSGLDKGDGAGLSASLLTPDVDQSTGSIKWAVGLVALGTGILLASAAAVVRRQRVTA